MISHLYLYILIWPLNFMIFFNYFYEHDFNDKMKKFIKYTFLIFVFLSIPLIFKHLAGYGNNGQVIFYTYFCLTTFPLVFMSCNKFEKKIYFIIVLIIIICSTKRGAILSFIFGFIFYIFISTNIHDNSKKILGKYIKYIFASLFILTIVYIITQYVNIPILDRLSQLSEDGGSGRDNIWGLVINSFNSSSNKLKIFGHGFQSVYFNLMPFGKHRFAHNSFIEFLYDTGYIGLGMLIFFIIYLILKLKKMIKIKSDYAAYMGFSLIITLVLSFISYFFEQSFIIIPISITWGIILGEEKKKGEIKK